MQVRKFKNLILETFRGSSDANGFFTEIAHIYCGRRTRGTFEKSSSRTVAQVATCSRGRRITRNCCDRLGWAIEQFCANTARAHACLVIVKIMTKKRPWMYDGYCPPRKKYHYNVINLHGISSCLGK